MRAIVKKLFVEFFHQLLPIGVGFTVLSVIMTLIDAKIDLEQYFELAFTQQMPMCLYDVPVNFATTMFCFIAVPIMTISVFKFNSERDSSDYYYSLAQSRTSLCNTAFLAVALYSLINIVANAVASFTPTTDSIDRVEISEYYYYNVQFYSGGSYVSTHVRITNAEQKQIDKILYSK